MAQKNIARSGDFILCLGIIGASKLMPGSHAWLSKAAASTAWYSALGCVVTGAYCLLSNSSHQTAALNTWAYASTTRFLQNSACNYFYDSSRSYAGLAAIYMGTGFLLEFSMRKLQGCTYKKAGYNLLTHSALSAAITTSGIMAGELVTSALGVNGANQGIFRNLMYVATRYIVDAGVCSMLNQIRDKSQYNEENSLIKQAQPRT